MDILEETFGAETAPVQLEELVGTPLPALSLPIATSRNRAATTALLTDDPSKAVDNYQMMLREGEEGQSQTQRNLTQQIAKDVQQNDIQSVMRILSDKNVSMEVKQGVISSFSKSQFLSDQINTLHTQSLSAGSRGETRETEDARISTADAVREIYKERQAVQGMVNAFAASLDPVNLETAVDLAAITVLPFGNTVSVGKINKAVQGELGTKSLWKQLKGFFLPGTATADMREKLMSIPPEKRVEFAQVLLKSIKNNSGVIFSNDNQYAQYEKAVSVFEEGGYGSFMEFVDNVSPLLDALGVGQMMRAGAKTSKAAGSSVRGTPFNPSSRGPDISDVEFRETVREAKVKDNVARIEYNQTVARENPASVAKVFNQTNPEKARAVHETVFNSSTDEIAEGLYGTSRVDALASDVMPQAATNSGKVISRVPDASRNLREALNVPKEVLEYIFNSGAIYFTTAEKAAARAHVVNDFASAEGLVMNEAMSSFALDGVKIRIGAVYGLPEGAFLKAEDAVSQALFALRKRGIREDEVTILAKDGLDHTPVKLEDVRGKEGNYLIRIDTVHDIDPTDITNFEKFDVKRNLFDRIGMLVSNDTGSMSRYLFDAASMLHPTYTGAASVATDATSRFDKILLDLAAVYTDGFNKLPKDRKALVNDYIRDANYNGIKFDTTDLIARGFSKDEIDSLKSWKHFWDVHFYLENLDVIRTLNAEGYQYFGGKNAELFARPIAKDSTIGAIYDPGADIVRILTKIEMDDLYAKGGTVARLRRPATFGTDTAEFMLVRNTPTEYLRKVRDSDKALNYRDGYFQLQYTAPRFVDQVIKDANGKVTGTKTVAVAGDTAEATAFATRMASSTGNEYKVRGDDRALQKSSDAYWDLNSASGRIAQRHRGKLLEDGSGLNHLGDGSYIINPVDSAIRAAKSIAGRTITRPMLEAAKARFVAQYGHMLPSNGIGGARWPKTVKEITLKGKDTSSEIADARTTYEYINYLENGYINSIDTAFKAGLNAVADMLGSKGLSAPERAAMIISSGQGPTSLAKNFTFFAYIASNVLRQLIIQPHQVVRTFAYNPVGWASGRVHGLAAQFLADTMGIKGTFVADGQEFIKFIKDSGLLDSVDKNNLVRGTLTEAADSTNKAIRIAGKAFEILREAGFDLGEQANLLGHAAAVFERYKRMGLDLTDKSIRDRAYSEIRAISYDMNFAGDMVYNQTSPAMVLQFMQVPHKAFLQMTTRRLDVPTRMRLIAGDLLLWGPPTVLVSEMLGADILPDNPDLKETVVYGLESMLLNHMFTKFSGEDVNIDFSGLAPYELTGWAKFFEGMWTGGFHDLLLNSPSGQLLFKDGSRLEKAIQSVGRYFGAVEDIDETPETFVQVMDEVAKISSGYSNWIKARILLDARKKHDQYGSVIDKDVAYVEAWAQALGFGTADSRDFYNAVKKMGGDIKTHREDVIEAYKEIKRYYYDKLQSDSTDMEFVTKVTGRVLKAFENDPVAMQIIAQEWAKDMQGKDSELLGMILKKSALPNAANLKDQVRLMPISDEEKQLIYQRIDDVQNVIKENK